MASVQEALRSGKFPERLSPLIAPKPFDALAYQKDPSTYLNTIEPGRVFQSKQPSPDVKSIERISPEFVTIIQKSSTTLQVKALPHMPVTFTSFDLGQFENQLTSITVEANAEGIAQTKFLATEGTIKDVNILASCPETSGRIKFVVTIELPR